MEFCKVEQAKIITDTSTTCNDLTDLEEILNDDPEEKDYLIKTVKDLIKDGEDIHNLITNTIDIRNKLRRKGLIFLGIC